MLHFQSELVKAFAEIKVLLLIEKGIDIDLYKSIFFLSATIGC